MSSKIYSTLHNLVSITCCVLGLLWWQLPPQQFPLTTPYTYHDDGVFSSYTIHQILTTGWTWDTPEVWLAPKTQFLDFPNADWLQYPWIWGLGLFTSNPFLVSNLMFWLSFWVIALSSYFCWKLLGFSNLTASLLSLVFAFLPYHWVRGTEHLLLSWYAIAAWVGYSCITALMPSETKPTRIWPWFLLGIAAAGSGIYYAVFSLWLWGLTCCLLVLQRPADWVSKLKRVVIAGGACTVLLLATLAPTLGHTWVLGKNPEAGTRLAYELDTNSLKAWRLFIPLGDYGISPLKKLLTHTSTTTENKQYLGIMGAIGFIGSLVFLLGGSSLVEFFLGKAEATQKVTGVITSLVLGCLLIAHHSGLATVTGYALTAQIRAYGRILPFLAFWCLTLVGWGVDQALRTAAPSRRWLLVTGYCVLIGLTIWDQMHWYHIRPGDQTRFASDQVFFEQLTAQVPTETTFFVLPYRPFPENPPLYHLPDYVMLTGNLHTTFSWSYPVIKGRPLATWYQEIAEQPENLHVALSGFGVTHIFIYKAGYEPSELEHLLKQLQPIETVLESNEYVVVKLR